MASGSKGGRYAALPGAAREQPVGAVRQKGIVGTADPVQAKIAGRRQESGEIARSPGGPGE